MRTAFIPLVVSLFATVAMGLAPHRSVIISWPNDTPDEIVEQSKEAIRKAKGKWRDGRICLLGHPIGWRYVESAADDGV